MKNLVWLMSAVLLAVNLSGCASRARLSSSFVAEEHPAGSIATVAEYLAQALGEHYPPGHTAIFLHQSGLGHDELGPALEEALRSRGFSLAPNQDDQALTVAYVLDRVDEETWYSRLTVSDGLTLARTWRRTGDDLDMEAATLTTQGSKAGQASQATLTTQGSRAGQPEKAHD